MSRKIVSAKIISILPYLLSFSLMWLFWMTAVSTSWARIAALQTIEPYAFAVHEQLLVNFSETGSFFQTIHRGYDDAWTWSGHRALTLPIVGYLYSYFPSPLGLSTIMISWFVLGSIGAGQIGRNHFGTHWGYFWGSAVYLLAPASMALALQDYQDLCLALPCLVIAWWLFEKGHWFLSIVGTLFAIAPREETIPMAIFCAVMAIPWKKKKSGRRIWKWKTHLSSILLSVSLAVFYVWYAQKYFPLNAGGHDMPLQNAVGSFGHERIFLEGWVYHTRFYALVFIPLGVFAYFAPLIAVPALALCLLHMTVPDGHGVDRSWSGHCHHMAPALAFSVLATIIGGSRVMNLFRFSRLGYWKEVLPMGIMLGAVSWSIWWWQEWADYYNLIVTHELKEPSFVHPVWKLKEQLPEDAIVVVNKNTALLVSDQRRSYTLDESLYGKERHKGLGAATHAIVDSRRSDIMKNLKLMDGFEILATEEPFILVAWKKGAMDRMVRQKNRFKPTNPYVGDYRKASDISGVPPRETKIPTLMGSFPVINLRDWKIE